MGIRGITVQLKIRTKTGEDSFGAPIYDESWVDVDDVLVEPTSSAENVNNMSLYGKMAAYTLAVPKADTHDWENTEVKFFGRTWKTLGMPLKGIDDEIPLRWNAKVQVERYE